ncbi:FecR domain-containing protein [Jiella avicenniae]|uniref:FecR domain-containing protein n=1 Tax=Jiella avicenniae TaxID=2907202 RepID=UPI001F384B22
MLAASVAAVAIQFAAPFVPGMAGAGPALALTLHESGASSLELLLADGTSITLAPRSQIAVRQFSYDGRSGARRLRLELVRGSARIAVGARGGTSPVEVSTPGGTVRLVASTALISADEGFATLVVGDRLVAEGAGASRTISRPGFGTVLRRGGTPAQPYRLDRTTIGDQMETFRSSARPRFATIGTGGTTVDSGPGIETMATARRAAGTTAQPRRQMAAASRAVPPQQAPQAARQPAPAPVAAPSGAPAPSAAAAPARLASATPPAAPAPAAAGQSAGQAAAPGNVPTPSPRPGADRCDANAGKYDAAECGPTKQAATLTPTPAAPQPPSLDLGSGLGDAAPIQVALNTQTASATTNPDAQSVRVGNPVRVRQDPALNGGAVGLAAYEDQRPELFIDNSRSVVLANGGTNQSVPPLNTSVADTSVYEFIHGQSEGIFFGLSNFRNSDNQVDQNGNATGFQYAYGTALFDLWAFATEANVTNGQVDINGAQSSTVWNVVHKPATASGNLNNDVDQAGNSLDPNAFVRTLDTSVYDFDQSRFVTVGMSAFYQPPSNNEVSVGQLQFDNTSLATFSVYDMALQNGGRFLAFGGPPSGAATNGPTLPGTNNGFTVSTYRISDGLRGFATGTSLEGQADGVAGFNANDAFRREPTFLGGVQTRADTDLVVVSGNGVTSYNTAMRGDFEMSANGLSNISVMVGDIAVQGPTDQTISLAGTLVGSTRKDVTRTSIAIDGPIGSLGTGYDATDSHFFFGNAQMGDAIGYFALGPADNSGGVGSETSLGQITEVASDGTTASYGFTRLAIGESVTAGNDPSLANRTSRAPTVGYAAGIGERKNADGTISLVSLTGATDDPNVAVDANPGDNNLVAVSIELQGKALGTTETPEALQMTMGDAQNPGKGAYVSEKQYAAVGNKNGVIVSPGELADGFAAGMTKPGQYDYAQWGFFFGDALGTGANGQTRVNLGHMVAGRPTVDSTITTNVQAAYAGQIIGTIADATSIRDTTGTFSFDWNFGSGTGAAQAALDGRQYTGALNKQTVASRFNGTLAHTGGQSTMTMNGGFFGPVTADPGNLGRPPETAGTVSISPVGNANYFGQGVFIGKVQ